MPTYIYLTHGSECLIDEGGKQVPNRRPLVPEGCTLSTITQSGVGSRDSDIKRLLRMSSIEQTRKLMMDPVTHHDLLSSIFEGVNNEYLLGIQEYAELVKKDGYVNSEKMGHEEYHLKVPGQPFTERPFEFILYDGLDDDLITVNRSGLYEIETFPTPLDGYTIKIHKDSPSVLAEDILELYNGSVFPSQAELKASMAIYPPDYRYNFFELVKIVDDIIKGVFQSTLMERFKGNHYNFSCRSYPNNVNNATVKRVRRNSITLTKRETPIRNKKLNAILTRRKEQQAVMSLDIKMIEMRFNLFANLIVSGANLSVKQKETIQIGLNTINSILIDGKKSIITDPVKLKTNIEILYPHIQQGELDIGNILSQLTVESKGGRRTRKIKIKRKNKLLFR
jgi:hypothetical protein